MVPNAFAWAREVPEVQTALWKAFRRVVLRGLLPRTVKEMMGVVASRRAGSEYAARVHLHALMVQGVEAPLLQALERGQVPEGFPPKVAALLCFAHGAALDPGKPELLRPLRRRGAPLRGKGGGVPQAMGQESLLLHLLLLHEVTAGFSEPPFLEVLARAEVLMVLDLDGLKALNDREGHLAGDALLRRLGACLQPLVRSHGGGVSASGGGEFALILPEMALEAFPVSLGAARAEEG
jgi:alkylhydroperoxidase/carboxymuconolactone decarboxylase family protein YurZ